MHTDTVLRGTHTATPNTSARGQAWDQDGLPPGPTLFYLATEGVERLHGPLPETAREQGGLPPAPGTTPSRVSLLFGTCSECAAPDASRHPHPLQPGVFTVLMKPGNTVSGACRNPDCRKSLYSPLGTDHGTRIWQMERLS